MVHRVRTQKKLEDCYVLLSEAELEAANQVIVLPPPTTKAVALPANNKRRSTRKRSYPAPNNNQLALVAAPKSKRRKSTAFVNNGPLALPAPTYSRGEGYWKCKMCEKILKGKRNLKKHFRHYHGDLDRNCDDGEFADLTYGEAAENLKLAITYNNQSKIPYPQIKLEAPSNYPALLGNQQVQAPRVKAA